MDPPEGGGTSTTLILDQEKGEPRDILDVVHPPPLEQLLHPPDLSKERGGDPQGINLEPQEDVRLEVNLSDDENLLKNITIDNVQTGETKGPNDSLSKSTLNIKQTQQNETKAVIHPPSRKIIPAHKIPKWIPNVDGTPWKVWAYPEFVELSTEEDTDVEESFFPPGTKFVGDDIDPESKVNLTDLGPKGFRIILKYMSYVYFFINGCFVLRYLYAIWVDLMTKKDNEKDPERLDSSSSSEYADL